MAYHAQHIRQTTIHRGNTVDTEREVTAPNTDKAPAQIVAARIIWFAAGVLLTLLAFRFFLALLGANPVNGFANFIYTISHPFVAPFFGVFNYNNYTLGASRFEVYTLFAMAVYAVIAWGLTYLVTINSRYQDT